MPSTGENQLQKMCVSFKDGWGPEERRGPRQLLHDAPGHEEEPQSHIGEHMACGVCMRGAPPLD